MAKLITIVLFSGLIAAAIAEESSKRVVRQAEDQEPIQDDVFTCKGKKPNGYYANTADGCATYFICVKESETSMKPVSFPCGPSTIFNQLLQVCTAKEQWDCSLTNRFIKKAGRRRKGNRRRTTKTARPTTVRSRNQNEDRFTSSPRRRRPQPARQNVLPNYREVDRQQSSKPTEEPFGQQQPRPVRNRRPSFQPEEKPEQLPEPPRQRRPQPRPQDDFQNQQRRNRKPTPQNEELDQESSPDQARRPILRQQDAFQNQQRVPSRDKRPTPQNEELGLDQVSTPNRAGHPIALQQDAFQNQQRGNRRPTPQNEELDQESSPDRARHPIPRQQDTFQNQQRISSWDRTPTPQNEELDLDKLSTPNRVRRPIPRKQDAFQNQQRIPPRDRVHTPQNEELDLELDKLSTSKLVRRPIPRQQDAFQNQRRIPSRDKRPTPQNEELDLDQVSTPNRVRRPRPSTNNIRRLQPQSEGGNRGQVRTPNRVRTLQPASNNLGRPQPQQESNIERPSPSRNNRPFGGIDPFVFSQIPSEEPTKDTKTESQDLGGFSLEGDDFTTTTATEVPTTIAPIPTVPATRQQLPPRSSEDVFGNFEPDISKRPGRVSSARRKQSVRRRPTSSSNNAKRNGDSVATRPTRRAVRRRRPGVRRRQRNRQRQNKRRRPTNAANTRPSTRPSPTTKLTTTTTQRPIQVEEKRQQKNIPQINLPEGFNVPIRGEFPAIPIDSAVLLDNEDKENDVNGFRRIRLPFPRLPAEVRPVISNPENELPLPIARSPPRSFVNRQQERRSSRPVDETEQSEGGSLSRSSQKENDQETPRANRPPIPYARTIVRQNQNTIKRTFQPPKAINTNPYFRAPPAGDIFFPPPRSAPPKFVNNLKIEGNDKPNREVPRVQPTRPLNTQRAIDPNRPPRPQPPIRRVVQRRRTNRRVQIQRRAQRLAQPDFDEIRSVGGSDEEFDFDHEFIRQKRDVSSGVDFPLVTSFVCTDKITGGLYADMETGCRMYHICVPMTKGKLVDYKYICPNNTAFNQKERKCDLIENVSCDLSHHYFQTKKVMSGQAEPKKYYAKSAAVTKDYKSRSHRRPRSENLACKNGIIGKQYADVKSGCRQYYICVPGQTRPQKVTLSCADGYIFDQKSQKCEKETQVNCRKSASSNLSNVMGILVE